MYDTNLKEYCSQTERSRLGGSYGDGTEFIVSKLPIATLLCPAHICECLWSQQRTMNSLELVSQLLVGWPAWVLGTELESSEAVASTPNQVPSPAPGL